MKAKSLPILIGTDIAVLMLVQFSALGANRFSVATGNWNSTSTWSSTSTGAAGFSAPIAGDIVTLQNGHTITVTADAAAASVTFTGAAATLTVNSNYTLTLSGAMKLNHNINNPTTCNLTGGGTVYCASVTAGQLLSLNGDHSAIFVTTLNSLNVSGDVTLLAKASGSNYGQASFRVEEGITTVSGQITSDIDLSPCIGTIRMQTGAQTGHLILSGANPWGVLTNVVTYLNGTGSTVEYNGSASQTILGDAYNNLRINTPATATLGASTSVNGILYMSEGILALNAKTLTYGATASIYYNGIAPQICGAEWPATFTRNIFVNNTFGLTLNENKVYNTSGVLTVNGHLNFSTHTLSGTGAFTVSPAATITSAYVTNGEGFGTAGDNTKGSIRVSGVRSLSTSASYILNGTGTAQNTGTNIPVTVNELGISNAAGVILTQNIRVNGNLNLSSGILSTGSYTLTAVGSVSNASATSYVNGKLSRVYSTIGSKDFAVGKGGNYSPISLQYSALTGISTVNVEQIEATLPGTLPVNTTKFSSRYWTISQSGGTAFSYNVTLNGSSFTPAGTAVMLSGDGITNTASAVTTPNYTNTIAFTSFSSNYGLGDMSSPTAYNVTGGGT